MATPMSSQNEAKKFDTDTYFCENRDAYDFRLFRPRLMTAMHHRETWGTQSMDKIRLQLYTKTDCPLCDEAKESLELLAARFPIQIEEIDITTNLGLFTKYKELIPVLELKGKRLFVHRIHGRALKRKLMWQRWRWWFIKKGWATQK